MVAASPAWQRFKAEPEGSMTDLCTSLAQGKSLRACAAELGITHWTLHNWVHDDPNRALQYARACDARAAYWAAEIEAIHAEPVRTLPTGAIDPADVAHKRLKLDTLKWSASKLAPKRYGDKLEVDATVKHDVVGELRAFLGDSSRLPIKAAE